MASWPTNTYCATSYQQNNPLAAHHHFTDSIYLYQTLPDKPCNSKTTQRPLYPLGAGFASEFLAAPARSLCVRVAWSVSASPRSPAELASRLISTHRVSSRRSDVSMSK
jgi:hypothetical protein